VPGPQSAARLPETGGDDVVLGLGALGIALYLAGVALFVVPCLVAGKQQEKE
jgi:LPXTG-motif cell wall-anchored protein